MPEDARGFEHPLYSELSQGQPWIEINPSVKDDHECNLCGQRLAEVKCREIAERKIFFFCPACKTFKQTLEDTSIKIVMG